MSLNRLLAEMDSREISEWMAYFKLESSLEKKGQDSESLKAKFQSLVPAKKDGGNRKSKS